ncbi:MAG: type II toxin-antitoxin system VapC family toxin [Treponema sp.]|nr:type II toxin-antitoxin system VapC family toxin [Treponema sp.]
MTGIDTCFLIDLYWQDSPRNKNARKLYSRLAEDESIKIAMYFNCFNEFLHVITDAKRFENPLSVKEAVNIIDLWCDLDRITVLYPDDTVFKRTIAWMNMFNLGRNRINDTQMAACYLSNNITSIITANPKDFEIFQSFELMNYNLP